MAKQNKKQNKITTTMDYKELMSHAPKDCQPKKFNPAKAVDESRKQLAKELGKKVEELTMSEEEEAMERVGLCSLDFMD